MTAQAHARRTDPQTSHMAADSLYGALTTLQILVDDFARNRPDGFLDVELVEARPDVGQSTLRTRRAELTARNMILDSMQRRKPDGATTPHTVWIHRRFVDDAPPLVEPEPPASSAERQQARDMAVQLEADAKQMRGEGRAMFSDQLIEAARLLRRLSQ